MRILRNLEKNEAMTASEAILAYGLNWLVEKKNITVDNKDVPQYKAITRQDNGQVFQIASDSYQVIQNADAFRFADEITKTGQAKYVNGGSYKNGAIVYLRLKMPCDFDVLPGDNLKTYLKIVNSHDGSQRLSIMPEVYRQICTNGMHAWVSDASKTVSVKHTVNAGTRFMFNAKNVLADEIAYFERFSVACRTLAKKQFSSLEMDRFLNSLFTTEETKEESTRIKNQKQVIKDLAENGTGIDLAGVRGTAWGAYNAVTEYVDNYIPSRAKDEESKDFVASFGVGKTLREKAFELLLKA